LAYRREVCTVMRMLTRTKREKRGIALLATTVISMIAVGTAIIVIKLTLDSTRVESANVERIAAKAEAEAVRVEFEEALAEAPYFYYSEVFAHERARVCTQNGDSVHQPGSAWPTACGTTWEYQQATSPGDVRVEIVAPGVTDPRLRLRILASAGRSEYGLEIHYATDSPARWTLYSETDLALDALPDGANTLGGEIHAGGVINLPTVETTMNGGLIVSEGGYGTHPDISPLSGEPVRFYGPTADADGSTYVESIRELYPTTVDLFGVRAMFAANIDIACPGADPVEVDIYTSHFCAREGEMLLNTDGNLVEVPAGSSAYLLLTGASGAGSIDFYYSTKTSGAPSTCGSGCDFASDSAGSIAAGTHPGDIGFWTKLGTFKLPDDGLIATDQETHIGLCGGGFASAGGTCSNWNGAGMMGVDSNLTVLVGSLTNIVDVYLSGPIVSTNSTSFGVVAAGTVYLPYWNRPAAGSVAIDGAYTGLGLGGGANSITTWPEIIEATANSGGTLSVDGGFAGTGIDTTFALYEQVSITGRPRHWGAPPPLYPPFYGTWRIVATRYLPSIEICDQLTCESY
jgi:hypothetical protein